MNPNEPSRLTESMAELLVGVQGMRQEHRDTNQRLNEAIVCLGGMNRRLNHLEKQTEMNTAAIGELRVSDIKLADKLEELVDINRRS